jgi:site-specific DNA recombinase
VNNRAEDLALRQSDGTVANIKSERERAKAALDRVRSQCGRAISIDAEKIDVFARLMIDKLENGDVNGRKAYIRAVISAIEVDENTVRIIGCKEILQAPIAGKQTSNGDVRGLVRKWCPGAGSNHRHCDFQSPYLHFLSFARRDCT